VPRGFKTMRKAARELEKTRIKRVSEGRREGVRKNLGPTADKLPEFWHCARCVRMGREGWQPGENFGKRRTKLVSGIVVTRWRNECRLCERERQAERRKNPEKREMDMKRRAEWAKTEKGKRYYREWGRMHRALNGAKVRGPNHPYKHEAVGGTPMVNAEPFKTWFEGLNGTRPTQTQLGESLARTVRRVTSGEAKKIHLEHVDAVGVIVGQPELHRVLYPDA